MSTEDPSTDLVAPVVLVRPERGVTVLQPVGSATYVIAGPTSMMLSAGHLFEEMERIGKGPPRSHPSMPAVFRAEPAPHRHVDGRMLVIREVGGRGFLRSIKEAKMLNDLAIGAVHENGTLSPPRTTAIDTTIPRVGMDVAAVGWSRMDLLTMDSAESFTFNWDRSVRFGKVTGIHPNGAGLCRGPCFEIDIAVDHGMSGGPIFDRDGGAAIGVISTGWEDGAVASMLWPMGGIELETPKGKIRVVDLIARGLITDHGRLHERLVIDEAGETRLLF